MPSISKKKKKTLYLTQIYTSSNFQSNVNRWHILEQEGGGRQEEGFENENGNLMTQAVCWRFQEKRKT